MKKVIAIEIGLLVLLAGIMFLLLAKKDPRQDITADQVQAMFEEVKGETDITLSDELQIRRQLGINPADYDMIVYYSSATDSMNVCEFLLIRTDESVIPELESSFEAHIASRLEAFEGYGEVQTEQLNKSIIVSYGNYICLIVGDEPSTWLDAVKALLEV